MNAKDLKPFNNIKALWIGPSGSRKSTALSSFPKPIYIFDIDGRIAALRGKDIDYDDYTNPEDAFDKLSKKLDTFVAYIKAKQPFPYKTIGFESISTGGETLVSNALMITGGMKERHGHTLGKLQIPDLEHYLYRAEAMRQIVYDYLKIFPCNVIVTAHTVKERNEDGTIEKKLYGSDKFSARFPISFSETWEFDVDEGVTGNDLKYIVRFRSKLAKTTFRELPNMIEVKDHDNFYESLIKAGMPKLEKIDA